jgi:hypothetical protein
MRVASENPARYVLIIGAIVAIAFAESGKHILSKPFTYESRGVGSNPVDTILRLKPGTERSLVSWAVLDALQRMDFSVGGRSGEQLQPDKSYTTDIVTLGDDWVASHDRASPNLQLWKEVVYGLQYKIRYRIDSNPRDRRLVCEVIPVLYQRGAATTRWHQYSREYSGRFFAERLLSQVEQNLQQANFDGERK